MYSHSWAVALLALTHIYQDCTRNGDEEDREASVQALHIENVSVQHDLLRLIEALESICDCSFRDEMLIP
jgi:hypothetical protein